MSRNNNNNRSGCRTCGCGCLVALAIFAAAVTTCVLVFRFASLEFGWLSDNFTPSNVRIDEDYPDWITWDSVWADMNIDDSAVPILTFQYQVLIRSADGTERIERTLSNSLNLNSLNEGDTLLSVRAFVSWGSVIHGDWAYFSPEPA